MQLYSHYERSCIDLFFFFSSRRRHTRYIGDWSSDVCSSDLHEKTHIASIASRSSVVPNSGLADLGSREGGLRTIRNACLRTPCLSHLRRQAGRSAPALSRAHHEAL